MEPDAADDPTDTDYAEEGRGGGGGGRGARLWRGAYLRRFTALLAAEPALLQRDHSAHERKQRALERMRAELGMDSVEQVRKRIQVFKKFAANKARQLAGAGGAPRWLRDLQPHLNLRTTSTSVPRKNTLQASTAAEHRAAPQRSAELGARGARPRGAAWVSAALIERARALRTLKARHVCRDVDVPPGKRDDLQYVWWRLLDVVRQKLSIQRDAGVGAGGVGAGGAGEVGARLSATEEALADLVLLLDDSVATLGESADYDSLQEQVALFHLAQAQGLETRGAGAAARWRRALRLHRARHHNISGLYSSIILLQRRWHELKAGARAAFAAYARPRAPDERKMPSALHAAIVKRFPHVVTAEARSWRQLVDAGLVVEDEGDESGDNAAGPPAPAPATSRAPPGGPPSRDEEGLDDEEDDLIVVEKEIETIDLIGAADEGAPPSAARDLPRQLGSERHDLAAELETELDRQLQLMSEAGEGDEGGAEGQSVMALFESEAPHAPQLFMYESDDELQCSEDRNQNIESIASQLASEGSVEPSAPVKTEPRARTLGEGAGREGASGEGGASDAENSEDDCVIDEKLLMVTRIRLQRVDSTPAWRRHASPRGSIRVGLLPAGPPPAGPPPAGPPPAAKRARCSPDPSSSTTDPLVKVKVEKDDSLSECESGERRGKLRARQRIAEILRDDAPAAPLAPPAAPRRPPGPLSPADDDAAARLTKKVQLPNIEEVRKNNLSMLTAQVAPLPSDEGGDAEGGRRPPRLSANSSDELHIDESAHDDVTARRDLAARAHDDVTLSRTELDEVLKRLADERAARSAASAASAGSAPVHCCAARRQHAVNAARRRIAARANRPAPAPLDLHSSSACVRGGGACACCCARLLSGAGEARLQRAADAVLLGLARIAVSTPCISNTFIYRSVYSTLF